jgi:alkylation response protein AidB-like acyl-CoA dehydrogenase
VFIDLTSEHRALQQQIRAYFRDIVTPTYEAALAVTEGGRPEYMKALKKMGADGWLGVGWPTKYGGQGAHADRAVHLLRRGVARGRAAADAHNHVGEPDDHAARHGSAVASAGRS